MPSARRRRHHRSWRVINEIERQAFLAQAVAGRVEALQRSNAALEHAFAALAVHVILDVTGQQSRDLGQLVREELRRRPVIRSYILFKQKRLELLA
jgi:hypothetical protein